MTTRSPRLSSLDDIRHLSTPLLWTAGVVIIFTVVFGDLPGEGKYAGVLQDACHSPAFATLSAIILILLSRRDPDRQATTRALLTRCAATVGLAILFGVGTELLQGMLGRDAEVDDAIADLNGSLGACGVYAYFALRGVTTRRARATRVLALLVCAGALAFWAAPLLKCAGAYWHRDTQFPVLAQFRSERDFYFLDRGGLDVGITPNSALRVTLNRSRYPGVAVVEPVRDWRGYHTLTLELENPGAVALSLHLRVNDRAHDGSFDDRFNTILALPAHDRQTFAVPLQRIATSPRARRMDMSRMSTLILFHDGAAPGESFLIDRIALE